jgi:hypothetical protein
MQAKFFVFLAIVLVACNDSDRRTLIQGSWKKDSVYTYYNGYGLTFRDMEESPIQHYQPNGRLRMTRDQESRYFLYSLPSGDSLIQQTLDQKNLGRFLILTLDDGHLALKKSSSPIFPGKNQEKYEIQYFSRIK